MRLSKLYSNQDSLFHPVEFAVGLNAILAEIRLPENRKKDTHNLGKTTLGRLIDFCFLAKRNPSFFLFKHLDRFEQFVFYLEIELPDSSHITVRRGVSRATKISFKKHGTSGQNLANLADPEWDHLDMPFERASSMLDSMLDWRALHPWSFRKGLGYQLRSQDDYLNVFQLQRYVGAHSDWKPFLIHILGFDAQLVVSTTRKRTSSKEKRDKRRSSRASWVDRSKTSARQKASCC